MNGATRAFRTAVCTQDSAFPAPLTVTDRTLPSDWKVTLILTDLSRSEMQDFTAPRTAPSAPITAALDGFSCLAFRFFAGPESSG